MKGAASLVAGVECWDWSSAAAHCGADSTGTWLAMHLWRGRWSAVTWRAYVDAGVTESQLAAIRPLSPVPYLPVVLRPVCLTPVGSEAARGEYPDTM
jgi:hypothetical protein